MAADKRSAKNNTPACRKEYIKKRVDNGIPIGLLAYAGGKAVTWHSIGPKDSQNNSLGGNTALENMWSLTCLFVFPEYREKGVTHLLIEYAKEYAKSNGAHYLEAYPVERDSPSYRHMGFVEPFEKEGFLFTGMAGSRRNIILCELL
ncbi:GNAT family N-acetyltransferase [Lacrimispora sp.]|uniref:GNAT family N-acetyltransferase n=1 Tax=Lacrimispora sp. TaxID=2719234 RepID=UPI0039E48E80